jgi:hypothetical protein
MPGNARCSPAPSTIQTLAPLPRGWRFANRRRPKPQGLRRRRPPPGFVVCPTSRALFSSPRSRSRLAVDVVGRARGGIEQGAGPVRVGRDGPHRLAHGVEQGAGDVGRARQRAVHIDRVAVDVSGRGRGRHKRAVARPAGDADRQQVGGDRGRAGLIGRRRSPASDWPRSRPDARPAGPGPSWSRRWCDTRRSGHPRHCGSGAGPRRGG